MYQNNFPLLPVFGGTRIEGNNGFSEKFVGMHSCVTFSTDNFMRSTASWGFKQFM